MKALSTIMFLGIIAMSVSVFANQSSKNSQELEKLYTNEYKEKIHNSNTRENRVLSKAHLRFLERIDKLGN